MSSAKKTLTFLKDIFIPVAPVKAIANKDKSMVEVIPSHQQSFTTSNNELNKNGNGKEVDEFEISTDDDTDTLYAQGHTHRRLRNRHIQLIGIGGTIGVGLYISMSTALTHSGPISLVLACIWWCTPILCVTAACAEMVCYLPIPSPFIRLSERCVDEAFSFMAGWNFWVLECSLIPFELTLFNTLIHYWRNDYSAAIPIVCQLCLYFLINIAAVQYYGEVEFYMAIGKVLLSIGLMVFTFITMCGGNPIHDAYGFRHWSTPFAEYLHKGDTGRWQGFLAAMITFSFLVAGPEYVSMSAGEVINPRKCLPSAYKQVAVRLTVFFVGGALAMGICCAYNDPLLLDAIENGSPGAGSSAYIIAMTNLKVKALPSIVSVMLLTSAFSAGNSYTYCSSRSLYGMALEGKAPRLFAYCNKSGVPIYAVLLSLCWGLLAFLQLGETASTVLDWIVNLVTASQMINFLVILITYLHFKKACEAQGIDRDTLPFKGWYQPYISYYGIFMIFIMIWVQGYYVFLPDSWSVTSFLFSYLMIFIDIALYLFWKILKKTKYVKPQDADLVTGSDEVDAHERHLQAIGEFDPKPRKWYSRISDLFFSQ
ncbi:hypothetical protein CANARDRAFT_176651 [[Candida] arabinofermentans NRRL YB-2248]|uniref:Amino acid permease/ SLC12A domain-containing protein n=1 Tax=[Candida] arabinofermentans NRRL YB-2248 TaxID=983967 RepID=A0A1E4SZB4_9ASCO|nr:hypothetical protein CANARDRAFT_176651 [[Candida] arabinofermentans NRRL YB-2248]